MKDILHETALMSIGCQIMAQNPNSFRDLFAVESNDFANTRSAHHQ